MMRRACSVGSVSMDAEAGLVCSVSNLSSTFQASILWDKPPASIRAQLGPLPLLALRPPAETVVKPAPLVEPVLSLLSGNLPGGGRASACQSGRSSNTSSLASLSAGPTYPPRLWIDRKGVVE